MNLTWQLHPVPLSAINLTDRTYCLVHGKTAPPDEKLLACISQFGILHPPIIQLIDKKSYRIVAGWKRILAAQQLTPDSPVYCRIISADIDKTAIFSLILAENGAGTPLSIVEQIIFFEKLLLAAPMEEAIPLLEQLGYKPQKQILKDLLQLRSLSRSALQGLHDGTVHLKTARKMLCLSESDQELIVQFIITLHFGGSKQQKLIDLCTELAMRKNKPLKSILAGFPSADALEQLTNIPQQGAALLSWLHEQCFPQVSQAENNFNRRVARLNLPATMKISHTPAFENEETTLSLRFPNWNSLEEVLTEITKLMQ